MEILGVGPFELIFILIIALIVLGPKDMVKAGKTVGRFLRKLVMSPTWKAVQQTSRDLRTLPNRLMREAGLEEELKDIRQVQQQLNKQMEEIQKLRSPIAALTADLNKETQEIRQDLGAWTTPPTGDSLPLSNQAAAANDAAEANDAGMLSSALPAETAAPVEDRSTAQTAGSNGKAEMESTTNPPVAGETNPINKENRQTE